MTRVYKIDEVQPLRTFQGKENGMTVDVQALGITLTDGRNTLYAEAYRAVAENTVKMNLHKGDLVQVHLRCNATPRDTEKGRFWSNSFTIDALQLLARDSF